MKEYNREVEDTLCSLYRARKRVARSIRAKIRMPEAWVANLVARVTDCELRLEELGITGEQLEQDLIDRWLLLEGEELAFDRYDRCLVAMRQTQAQWMAEISDTYGSEAPDVCEKHPTCADCPFFVEASEEQTLNHNHGCDLDTGELRQDLQLPEDDSCG